MILTFARLLWSADVKPRATPDSTEKLSQIALVQMERGDYAMAHSTAQRALDIVTSNHLEATLAGAEAFAAMGTVLQAESKIGEAEEMLKRALSIRERLLSRDDPRIAYTLNSLALAYRRHGRLADAGCLFRRAIDIYERIPGSKDLAAVLNNLGRVVADQSDHKQAEQLFRRAIGAAEQTFGPDHPETAVGLSNLGNLLVSRHKFNESASLLERAAAIDRRNFPQDNIRIGYDLNNAAHLAFERKRYFETEQLLTQSEAILEKNLTATHPDVGQVMANLAEAYRLEGRLEESEALYKRALSVLEQAWGTDSALLLPTIRRYALVLRAREEFAEAEQLQVQSTKIAVAQSLRNSK